MSLAARIGYAFLAFVFCGFPGCVTKRVYFLTAEVCRPEPVTEDTVRVLKLHGSVNWAGPSKRRERIAIMTATTRFEKRTKAHFWHLRRGARFLAVNYPLFGTKLSSRYERRLGYL
jgi:hypothetical protein